MKLPDFFKFEPLNETKRKMGISADVVGTLEVKVGLPRLTLAEIVKLTGLKWSPILGPPVKV